MSIDRAEDPYTVGRLWRIGIEILLHAPRNGVLGHVRHVVLDREAATTVVVGRDLDAVAFESDHSSPNGILARDDVALSIVED